MPNRRTFIAAVGALTLRAGAGWRPLLEAAAPRLERIGLQLYTVRSEMARDVARTLAGVAGIGYREVEFAGYFGRSARELRDLLSSNGLTAPSAHVPFSALGEDWKRELEMAREVGHQYITIPWIPEEERRSLDSWKRLAELFNSAAAQARDIGLRFAYHNHDFEFTRIGGAVPFDTLMASTDRALVEFQLDLYWITRAGGDPAAYLTANRGRFPMVHVKDSAGGPGHRMVDVGEGTIDFRRLLSLSREAGTRHFFVEHDRPEDPMASVRRSYEYLTALEL